MRNVNRQSTTPVKFPRSKRNHAVARITSVQPGVCAPLAAIPLFRGDGIVGRKSGDGAWTSSRLNFAIEMAETKDLILNKVRARVTAYCVPMLAFERFSGSRDEFDRSYAGEESLTGDGVVPFVETHAAGAYGSSAFYKTQGLHAAPGTQINTMYLEAYNAIWNYRAKNRSEKITPRARLVETLAPAFWPAGRFEHLVPDYDSAVMDGAVALRLLNPKVNVAGDGHLKLTGMTGGETAGLTVSTAGAITISPANAMGGVAQGVKLADGDASGIFAELDSAGVFASLADLKMAREVQAFAKLRAAFEGHDDDYIIDTFLMNGLRLPDEALKRPFLVADETATFTQVKRYATDSGNLDESASSGVAQGSITLRVPTLDVGGIVMVMVEILPDQLFERQKDPFLHSPSTEEWPQALRDYADPEKVDIVTNGEVDVDHSDDDGLFGYGPKNWKWNAFGPGIGGKFFKPSSAAGTNALRQRFWAHEEEDPALAESFYICQGLSNNIFLDETTDPFDVMLQGNAVIDGLTQFGGALIEATDNYDKVMEQMDTSRAKEGAE